MKPFIAHCRTADGKRLDAIIMSDSTLERTRDVYEAALQEEFPGAVILDFHPAHVDEEDESEPATIALREPRAIESMVMYGWAAMIAILTFLHWLNRNRKDN